MCIYIHVGFPGDEVQRFQDRLKDLLAGEADQRTFCDLLNDQLFQYEYYFTIRHLQCVCCYCTALNAGWSSCEKGVCPFICLCLSNACIVTKWKKDLSRFLYHMKDHLAEFSEMKNGWWGVTPSRYFLFSRNRKQKLE